MRVDKAITQHIFELLETLIGAAEYVEDCLVQAEEMKAEAMVREMQEVLLHIQEYKTQEKVDEDYIQIACKCIIYSLNNVIRTYEIDKNSGVKRIGYELIPFIKNTQKALFLRDNAEECSMENLIDDNFMDKYYQKETLEGIKNKEYKYELSIVVYGYNQLEYTRMCVESILKYVPENITYELVLVNHGSSDGTKEYFESVNPNKQIDVLINRAVVINEINIEGKYMLNVSNDIIITKNSISNMIRCMESDDKISKIVPATTNVSNLQSLEDLDSFDNFEEMQEVAERNNQYDEFRHEQRARLCDPIALYRIETLRDVEYIRFVQSNILEDMFMFPDDILSLYFRRKGKKQVLAKDAFCYHFGSITLESEIAKQGKDQFYLNGRSLFYKKFNIDPWGTGVCFDMELMKKLSFDNKHQVKILGINCGIGSNPLKIREAIKEKTHNLDVKIYNMTDAKEYKLDLAGMGDFTKVVKNEKEIQETFKDTQFDYIVWEDNFRIDIDYKELVEYFKNRLASCGILAIKINSENELPFWRTYPNEFETVGVWIIIRI